MLKAILPLCVILVGTILLIQCGPEPLPPKPPVPPKSTSFKVEGKSVTIEGRLK